MSDTIEQTNITVSGNNADIITFLIADFLSHSGLNVSLTSSSIEADVEKFEESFMDRLNEVITTPNQINVQEIE